jgi:type II secretory pathway component GspD/PulD (secretin)
MKMRRPRNFILILIISGLFCVRGFDICRSEEVSSAQPEEKISFDLKNVEITELLRILSLRTGKTIVPTNQIAGRITLFLNNVSFGDVLDIILLTQNFALEQKGNIFYIMTAAEYRAVYGKEYLEQRKIKTIKLKYAKPANVFNAISQMKSEIGKIIADESSGIIIMIDIPDKLETMEKSAKELDQPLETAVFDLNYVKPADAKSQLSAAVTPGTGEVIVDERSGKVVISDLSGKMKKLKELVKELDEETRQVFIEADIVEVSLSNNFQRGINWEKIYGERALDGLDLAGYFPLTLSYYQKLSVGTLAANNYNAALNFLETYGDVKTISQPRIAIVNNEEANIMVGTRDAYISQTLSQAESTTVTSESVEFIDVGVKLKITPIINKDGFITMKIKPEVSSVKETITTSLGSRIPIVQTAEAETTVKVKDGTMIMIAGLMRDEKSDTRYGLPFLSRIPVLGAFFSNREKESTRSELIIFITPYISRGDIPIPGSEPQRMIRADIMPKDMKEKLSKENKMTQAIRELDAPRRNDAAGKE